MHSSLDPSKKPIGLEVKEQTILKTSVGEMQCSMMDKRTRQILIYLLNHELKRNKSYPTEWVQDLNEELEIIKKGLEMCNIIQSRKKKKHAFAGIST